LIADSLLIADLGLLIVSGSGSGEITSQQSQINNDSPIKDQQVNNRHHTDRHAAC
jgi:hypothetical protein